MFKSILVDASVFKAYKRISKIDKKVPMNYVNKIQHNPTIVLSSFICASTTIPFFQTVRAKE